MKELVVTGPKSPAIASADDLAGKTVHVRKASSYYESLEALNGRFKKEGKPAAKLVLVPDALEDEDMMEMLNAGLLEVIVVDDWKAKMWAQILPKIKVNEQVAVREGGKIGWAIRKGSPKLEAEILDFYQSYLKKQGVAAYRLKQYMSRVKQIKNPTGTSEWKRFEQTLVLFQKYGEKYNFDPLMLAAQGYQESQLNQNAKSHVGAIGVMQVMPATGKELKVGDIRVIEPNIHAGAKYMDQLMTKYFPDANFTREQPDAVRLRELQLRPGKRLEDAQGGRQARARPGQVVQQRGDRDGPEDRHGDHHLRAQHLQVLRRLQAPARRDGGDPKGPRAGGAGRRANRHGGGDDPLMGIADVQGAAEPAHAFLSVLAGIRPPGGRGVDRFDSCCMSPGP